MKSLEDCQEAIKKDHVNHTLIEEECKAKSWSMTTQKAYYEFLLQKTKQDWIKDGDANSTLFHASIK